MLLPFGAVTAGDMFQKTMDKLFSGMPNSFIIANDILTAGFDEQGRDHDAALDNIPMICRSGKLTKKGVLSDAPAFHS